MQRNRYPVVIVGVQKNPMFTIIPFHTISQRNKAYADFKKKGEISLKNQTGEITIYELRYIACAVITTQHVFPEFKIEEEED